MKFYKFKEMLDNFVADNCSADGCRECHEIGHTIVIDDEEALKKLFEDVFK